MIIGVTDTMLTPSNNGCECLHNGEHMDINDNLIESCCDECDHFLTCYSDNWGV